MLNTGIELRKLKYFSIFCHSCTQLQKPPNDMSRNTTMLDNTNDMQRKLLEASKRTLLASFEEQEIQCEMNGTKLYFPNQEATAEAVVNIILNEPSIVFQLVKAETQTGKTGCMIAVIKLCFTLAGCELNINPQNIIILTGISSTDWRDQTKDRFPSVLEKMIFHRNDLKKLGEKLTGLRDVLIVMDEVHIAAKEGMTIDKMLENIGFKDMNVLRERNINFIEFSATPNKVMEDMNKWEGYTQQHVMQSGTGYKGVRHLLENRRVFQAEDLFIDYNPDTSMNADERDLRLRKIHPAYQALEELKSKIDTTYSEPRYHIVRLPSGEKFNTVMTRFRDTFGHRQFDHIACHSTSENNEIQTVIKELPSKHTIIYIKEHLRCAVTLHPKNTIGILYERISVNDDVMIQGLAGRATGYNVPDDMLVYTNIDSLKRYNRVLDSGFTDMGDFTYQGKRNKCKSKPTFMSQYGFANNDYAATEESELEPDYKRVLVFPSLQEAREFGLTYFGHKFNKPSNQAPSELRVQNGANPTADYIKRRFWGIHDKIPIRMCLTDQQQFCVWWSIKFPPKETETFHSTPDDIEAAYQNMTGYHVM